MASRNDKLGTLYEQARRGAKHRGIGWEFDFESWLKAWRDSGRFEQRGPGADDFVMARLGDVGPYRAGNVEFITRRQNSVDGNRNRPATSAEAAARSLGRGRGWTMNGGRFQVVVSHKYVGLYSTQEEAEIAYAGACNTRAKELGLSEVHAKVGAA